MKRYFYYVAFLFISIKLQAQVSGRIEYALVLSADDEFSKGDLASFYNEAYHNASYVKFILDFNKSEMLFYSITPKIDDVDTSFSIAFSGVIGSYYRKAGEDVILNAIDHPLLGKIVIRQDSKLNWELSTESKMIEGFLCYKASTTLSYNNGVGKFEKPLIAWYCPKLPYSFGPKAYGNLPGIILQLQEKGVVIGAKKIIFDTNKSEIVQPSGKIITEEEFGEKLKNYYENEKN